MEMGPEGVEKISLVVVLTQKCPLHPKKGLNSGMINTVCTNQKHYMDAHIHVHQTCPNLNTIVLKKKGKKIIIITRLLF